MRVRVLAWVIYFIALIYPTLVLVDIFFIDIQSILSIKNDFELGQLALAQLALVSVLGIFIFNVIWIEWRRLKSDLALKITKIAKIMIFVFLFLLAGVTFYSIERLISRNIFIEEDPEIELKIEKSTEICQDTIKVIPVNGSLCGTLGMNIKEAHHYANLFKRKHYWHSGIFYVLVYPGERFMKVGDLWLPMEK